MHSLRARRRRGTIVVLGVLAAAVMLGVSVTGCGDDGDAGSTGSSVSATTAAPSTGATGSTGPDPDSTDLGDTVTLMTHDSFAVSEGVLEEFTAQTGVVVKVLRAGDAGAMINQAILAKDNPLADVIYGIDNTFLSRALDEGILQPYESPALAAVPAELQLDPESRATPIDFADVAVNYDKEAFAGQLKPPATLQDLTKPEYRGMLVVESPATSSPGLAFLLLTIATFGESGGYDWKAYWQDLVENDVLVVSGWEDAYYSAFSGGSGAGDRPLVVSYATSPAAEVIFAETPLTESPTGVAPPTAFRQVEFAGLLAQAPHAEAGRRLIDFMLSRRFQEDVPLQMFVYPANSEAEPPADFTTYAVDPTTLSHPDGDGLVVYESIGANRDRWIEEWAAIATP